MEKSIEDQIADLKQQQENLITGTTCNLEETMKAHNALQQKIDALVAQLPPDDEPFTGITQLRG